MIITDKFEFNNIEYICIHKFVIDDKFIIMGREINGEDTILLREVENKELLLIKDNKIESKIKDLMKFKSKDIIY